MTKHATAFASTFYFFANTQGKRTVDRKAIISEMTNNNRKTNNH